MNARALIVSLGLSIGGMTAGCATERVAPPTPTKTTRAPETATLTYSTPMAQTSKQPSSPASTPVTSRRPTGPSGGAARDSAGGVAGATSSGRASSGGAPARTGESSGGQSAAGSTTPPVPSLPIAEISARSDQPATGTVTSNAGGTATPQPVTEQAKSPVAEERSGDAPAAVGSAQGSWTAPRPAGSPWGEERKGGTVGLVYPEAPAQVGIDSKMVDGLQLPPEDPRRKLIGVWEQIEGPNTPDVAHGGYSQTVLALRTDGVLEIIRYYGRDAKVRLDTRLTYKATDGVITVDRDSKSAKAEATPKPIRVPVDGSELVATPPASVWPQLLKFAAGDDRLTLGDKKYKRKTPAGTGKPASP